MWLDAPTAIARMLVLTGYLGSPISIFALSLAEIWQTAEFNSIWSSRELNTVERKQ